MTVNAPDGIASSAVPGRAFASPPTAGVLTGGVDDCPADDLDISLADLFAAPDQSSAAAFVFAAPIPRGGDDIPPGIGGNRTISRAVTPVNVTSKTTNSPKFTSLLHGFGLTMSKQMTSPVVKDGKLCVL